MTANKTNFASNKQNVDLIKSRWWAWAQLNVLEHIFYSIHNKSYYQM